MHHFASNLTCEMGWYTTDSFGYRLGRMFTVSSLLPLFWTRKIEYYNNNHNQEKQCKMRHMSN